MLKVSHEIQWVKGIKNKLFGGEGLFMTELVGPGRVLLQSLKRRVAASRQSPGR